ncbi:MAG TPA: M48 family peptidase [Aquifex aeolicus]|uniref:M48 family peptidase n=1 Tax=Aquifex aeolicus TaxID=63363 RepID=A0A9D1CFN9_AQUAO|nr:M48 family peptidase [Aquificales bacterium]HIP86490.1 M48 family peptidase [Aquifex sp.]HIP98332.1 M48 family peptidase [Aquifex aeolicus]HIQ25960.1 M48 family peptidase [Aquifex aeolicus]
MSGKIFPLLIPLFSFLIFSCTTKKPVTEGTTFVIVSHSQEVELGRESAQKILGKEKLVTDPRYTRIVKETFRKLVEALPPKHRDGYKWNVYVLDRKEVNAFALPSGDIFLFQGLLDFISNDEGMLATVLSHEIAHVILRHSAEKITMATLARVGELLLLNKIPPENRGLAREFYELGVNIAFLMPYSRQQEKEADAVGLLLLFRAGYNPQKAVYLWRKFTEGFAKGEPPEWFSTHPSSERRLRYISRLVRFLEENPQYISEFRLPAKVMEKL